MELRICDGRGQALQLVEVGKQGWEGWRAHPHSQCKDAASAEPRSEQGPVSTACYGDVALLVVTYGRGGGRECPQGSSGSRPAGPKAARLGGPPTNPSSWQAELHWLVMPTQAVKLVSKLRTKRQHWLVQEAPRSGFSTCALSFPPILCLGGPQIAYPIILSQLVQGPLITKPDGERGSYLSP